MEERCANCKYCSTLYTPPTVNTDAKHEYCCTLFLLDANEVMYLGKDIYSLCECFTEK